MGMNQNRNSRLENTIYSHKDDGNTYVLPSVCNIIIRSHYQRVLCGKLIYDRTCLVYTVRTFLDDI